MGLEKTLEVLDTLRSSMSNLNAQSGFISSMTSRGNKISLLAFEVANKVSKGANLFQSLSEENVNFLKKEILYSEVLKNKDLIHVYVSTVKKQFDVFSREVIRFGDLCKDPIGITWDNTFQELSTNKKMREVAEMIVHELTTLVQHASAKSPDTFAVVPMLAQVELYYELHSLDSFEQDYQRKVELQCLHLPQKVLFYAEHTKVSGGLENRRVSGGNLALNFATYRGQDLLEDVVVAASVAKPN
ncbi:Protein PSK SIMULATOR 2 [Linum perenne]